MDIALYLRALQKFVPTLTQKEMAEECGRTQPSICYLMKSKAGNPRPSAEVVAGINRLMLKHGVTEDDIQRFSQEEAEALLAA
jgi:hypothetical protein